ncbi:LPXTG cell wall anchor domain-containing protein [Kitasatospora sp. NPDC056531]|uniref:LPXTG cell wall anchor domain-containing protein n=1 Tax=Kitasatospora sp. NPDC056531 TaxID=3345856 RepID=UPI00368FFB84
MRTSVITRFAKNDRAFSGRRRVAVLAATTVLAGGVQFLATDTAWACGDVRYSAPRTVDKPTVPAAGFRVFESDSIAADGGWTEFGLSITNFTGADVPKTAPNFGLSIADPGTPLRAKDVRVEVMQHGSWKSLKLLPACNGLDTDTSSLAQPLANGRAANFMFRVSLSPDSPKDQTALSLVTDARNDKGVEESWDHRVVKVTHPKTAPAAKPTQTAKPKPAPTKETKHAEPAADQTPAKETPTPAAETPKSPAPQATSSAPATTAPAGTPELAHTGASETNTFLAVSAAALLALGAGVLIAVRRLRPQR